MTPMLPVRLRGRGHDPSKGGADIIAPRRRQGAHAGDDRDFGVDLKIVEGFVDLVAGQDFTSGRIHPKDDRLDRIIVLDPLKLVPH